LAPCRDMFARGLLAWFVVLAWAATHLIGQVDAQVIETASEDASAPAAVAPTGQPKAPTVRASLRKAVEDPALELIDPRTDRLKIVIRVDAPDGVSTNVAAVGPIPMEWPEQRLRLLSETVTPGARAVETVLKGQAAMLKLTVPTIAKGGFASVERLYEITRY